MVYKWFIKLLPLAADFLSKNVKTKGAIPL